ncbi:hypothetical protein GCM10023115_12560 [Pontixanthobacter gangjinensis]|uniref:CHAT domain-containing protein n=1 Tax=Pontixanthobacter gangjinensis TaxID=1028742 RepID=A0A6I4SKT1_9SPHN|nr:CHAT domain-containing protein [Pontixanthobacter gangjinensis]MXO56501.1 CHAT domain-containing protein [Pontixanthobacter gangjinensis]
MKKIVFATLISLVLSGCDNVAQNTLESPVQLEGVSDEALANLPNRFVDLPEPADFFEMPESLSERGQQKLLEAVAGSTLFAKQIRRKEQTGHVVIPGKEPDLVAAKLTLEAIHTNLASLSRQEPETYALIHHMTEDGYMEAWLIAPDGRVVSGRGDAPYTGLSQMSDDLGVTRMAGTRTLREQGEEELTPAEIANLEKEDRTKTAIEARRRGLKDAADSLLPGHVSDVLGSRAGRLLIVAAKDSGTAPYAALPLANGYLAENWSLVVMPDVLSLGEDQIGFDFGAIDINKAVIVGNPDLTSHTSQKWRDLPGAKEEALAVSNLLPDPNNTVLIGEKATTSALRRAISKRRDTGLVYIASHAVSNNNNPLTRSYIAMAQKHYWAGEIRVEQFPGWKNHHPLVVLSACQTGLGRTFEGGHFGISKTWKTAGAGQVVASLWNVDDKATNVLMTKFVTHLKAGIAPEFAMQKAQIDTLHYENRPNNRPYFNDPKKWASFTVFGQPSLNSAP